MISPHGVRIYVKIHVDYCQPGKLAWAQGSEIFLAPLCTHDWLIDRSTNHEYIMVDWLWLISVSRSNDTMWPINHIIGLSGIASSYYKVWPAPILNDFLTTCLAHHLQANKNYLLEAEGKDQTSFGARLSQWVMYINIYHIISQSRYILNVE